MVVVFHFGCLNGRVLFCFVHFSSQLVISNLIHSIPLVCFIPVQMRFVYLDSITDRCDELARSMRERVSFQLTHVWLVICIVKLLLLLLALIQ